MKTRIELSNGAYFWHFTGTEVKEKVILIVPNSAGYYAESEKYGKAHYRVDRFCLDLSKEYEVYYLVLPGQDPENPSKYSYKGSIEAVRESLTFLIIEKHYILEGVIGMCTGGAIAAEALYKVHFGTIPLILYNTAESVRWNDPRGQKAFSEKYGRDCIEGGKPKGPVLLDYEELLKNAPPNLSPFINKHEGRILQIVSGESDYSLKKQKALNIPNMERETFMSMSDVPIGESVEYPKFLNLILNFFKQ